MALYRAGASAEKPTLLWTNENPSSAFAGQTLNVDCSDYKWLIFKIKNSPSGTYIYYLAVDVENNQKFGIGSNTNANIGVGNGGYIRNVDITNNTLKFSTGFSTAGTSSANNIIPLEVYGLKKSII